MKTSKQTAVKRKIFLEPEERFLVKAPRTIRMQLIGLIEVQDGCFFLYGAPRRGRNSGEYFPIHHGYRGTNEVPMPREVALEVGRCLAAFASEGGSFTSVSESSAHMADTD